MSRPADRHRLELEALRYLEALDAGDLEAVAAFWERAETEPELEELLRGLDEGLYAEEGPGAEFAIDAARVVELARRHLPSAFPSDEPPGPLTAADVARRLEAEPEFRRLDAADRAAHARLLAEATSPPDQLGIPRLIRWSRAVGVTASPQYWELFNNVAVLLRMAACQQRGRLAAARRADPPKKPDEGTTP